MTLNVPKGQNYTPPLTENHYSNSNFDILFIHFITEEYHMNRCFQCYTQIIFLVFQTMIDITP